MSARLLDRTLLWVWLTLMAATGITTWWVSKDQIPAQIATVATLLIVAFKIRLVMLYFMELRHAPLPWRLFFEAWVLVVTAVILGCYLLPGASNG